MADMTLFQSFVEAVAEGKHNFATATLKVALTSVAPSTSNSVLADLTQISYTNLSSRTVTTSSSSQTGGVYSLVCADLELTASGAVAPFRYIVLYNDSATNDELIGFWDFGSPLTLANGDVFVVDFDATGVFSLE